MNTSSIQGGVNGTFVPAGTSRCRSAAHTPHHAVLVRGPRASLALAQEQTAPETHASAEKRDLQQLMNRPYKYGFKTIIESDVFPPGLNEDVVCAISAKKNEPEWLLEFRLKAYRKWLTMEEPNWSDNQYPQIDYQALSYYSAPKVKEKKMSLDEVS